MTNPQNCFDCKCLERNEEGDVVVKNNFVHCQRSGGECYISEEVAKTQPVCCEVE